MGCINPTIETNIEDNVVLSQQSDKSNTLDFKDFFIINNRSPSIINQKVSMSPFLHATSISIIPDISTINCKEYLNLKLQLFSIESYQFDQKVFDNGPPIDSIIITPNSIQSKQGKFIKYKGVFSFGRQTENNARLDYNISNDPNIAPNQFDIFYDLIEKKYHVNETKNSTGLFKKIESFTIYNEIVLNYCKNNIKFFIDNNNKGIIQLMFIDGEFKDKVVPFDPEKNKIIHFGRAKTNEIISRNDSVSRIQWTLIYTDSKWIIYDGNLNNGIHKPSTNGLWLLVQENIEITNDSIWKTGGIVLYAKK